MSNYVRPEVAQLHIPKLTTPHHQHALQQNVSPLDYPEALKDDVMRRVSARNWSAYQDPYPTELVERLAAHLALPADMLLIGNGSAELIWLVLSASIGRGDHMILNTPNFIRYQLIGRNTGATVHMVPSIAENDFELPVDEILNAARTHQARLIALCSPNNPTGATFARQDIQRLATESDALLLIDAAYEEFSDQDTGSLPLEFENVIILRTFSKAMNMASLRVGYAIMHPRLAGELEKAKLHYVPNIFSETAALVALENYEIFSAQVQMVKQERLRLYRELSSLPQLHIFPSAANFFLMRFSQPSTQIFNYLLNEHGILTMDLGKSPQLQNHLRVSLGTPEQNDLLIEAIRKLPNAVDVKDADFAPVLA